MQGFRREVMKATDDNDAWKLITREDVEERQLIITAAITMTTTLLVGPDVDEAATVLSNGRV